MPSLQQVGMYEVIGTINEQPGHEVYKVQVSGGRPLAMKTAVRAELTDEDITRFLREAEVCGDLDHRNLMQVFDSGEADGILYQVMDLLEGEDLAAIFGAGRIFTWPQKSSIMQQVCEGMEYAHRLGLVHRNLLPAHVFVEQSGRVRILDFGAVRSANSSGESLAIVAAFQAYACPELIQNRPCTPASDVFSMGVIFYELCTGRHPFRAAKEPIAVVMDNIVKQTPPPVTQVAPGAPGYLDRVLQQALHKDPRRRPADAGVLRALMAQASAEDRE